MQLSKLILVGLVGLQGILGAQEPRFETDMYKYIPKGERVITYDFNGDGKLDAVWYDKNKDGIQQEEEIFIELNDDGIPDMPLPEFKKWYKNQKWKEEEVKNGIV